MPMAASTANAGHKSLNHRKMMTVGSAFFLIIGGALPADAQPSGDGAVRFGAMESVRSISLSPDGQHIAYISPDRQQGRILWVVNTEEGAEPRRMMTSDGNPSHLSDCRWATNLHLVCVIFARENVVGDIISATTVISVNTSTGALERLSVRRGAYDTYFDTRGGRIIDWLSSDGGAILMTRSYVPEARNSTRIYERREGLGVDRIDVESGRERSVEQPDPDAINYITDGNGHVRLREMIRRTSAGVEDGIRIAYRSAEGGDWSPLGIYNRLTDEGWHLEAVDSASNSAIGFTRIDGRMAAISVALDGSGRQTTLYAHPQVDVDGLIRIGRNRRVIGVSYATDYRRAVMTDPALARMVSALSRALGGKSVQIVDTNADESMHLILATSDTDPGQYYLYTPAQRQLRPLLSMRPELDDVSLATVTPIQYAAGDGTMIPGYLTLPPGRSDARGLPAIVMPHGGPSARDEWGFDWLAQYFAHQGYAVLQPNFRGSAGYGEAWLLNNGFVSWRTAIGDVDDGGRWLLSQGADPARLSIVGWSYGGYAALQSGVTEPGLFKAIVAIAPVADLPQMRDELARFQYRRDIIAALGSGPHIMEGSPARHAGMMSAPVLMFHGTNDQNVDVEQSRTMDRELRQAGKSSELVIYPGLAHDLGTSEARGDMLSRISTFLSR